MKKLYLLAIGLLAAGLVLSTACGGEPEGELNLTYEVTDNGTSVKLSWDAVEGAEAYSVTVDGKLITDTITGTTYKVTEANAGKKITVAVVDAEISESIDFAALVKTTTLTNFGEASSPYKSAVGFNPDGSAVMYSLTDTGNYAYFDFWISDGTAGTVNPNEIDICSPNVTYGGSGNFNSKDNWSTAWGTGYVAPTEDYQNIYPGNGGIMGGKSYALWIDPSGNEWDLNDHFVRIDISSVANDGQVQGQVHYQTVGGLLWIPVD